VDIYVVPSWSTIYFLGKFMHYIIFYLFPTFTLDVTSIETMLPSTCKTADSVSHSTSLNTTPATLSLQLFIHFWELLRKILVHCLNCKKTGLTFGSWYAMAKIVAQVAIFILCRKLDTWFLMLSNYQFSHVMWRLT
jgi:hypothetical protein